MFYMLGENMGDVYGDSQGLMGTCKNYFPIPSFRCPSPFTLYGAAAFVTDTEDKRSALCSSAS